ncbi:hypothetical protein JXI42_09010 [bacterium]|nr:hypothetical protein [bacterium]
MIENCGGTSNSKFNWIAIGERDIISGGTTEPIAEIGRAIETNPEISRMKKKYSAEPDAHTLDEWKAIYDDVGVSFNISEERFQRIKEDSRVWSETTGEIKDENMVIREGSRSEAGTETYNFNGEKLQKPQNVAYPDSLDQDLHGDKTNHKKAPVSFERPKRELNRINRSYKDEK